MTFAGQINLATMRETVLKGQGADKRFLLFMAAYGIDVTEGRVIFAILSTSYTPGQQCSIPQSI
jgi:hypothetical protein